jgi:hypothetical protein
MEGMPPLTYAWLVRQIMLETTPLLKEMMRRAGSPGLVIYPMRRLSLDEKPKRGMTTKATQRMCCNASD